MKLVFVITSMVGGGAQRVLSILANYWAEKNWNVTIITLDSKENISYFLNSRIHLIHTGISTSSASALLKIDNIKKIKQFRENILSISPDIVISFIEQANVFTLAFMLFTKIKIIVSERVDISQFSMGIFWSLLRSKFYLNAAAIVLQSKRISLSFELKFQDLIKIIPNPVLKPKLDIIQNHNNKVQKIYTAGRLTFQKGYDLLFQAFALIKRSDIQLVILGDGPEKENLVNLAKELKIESRIIWKGWVSEPLKEMAKGDLFVLPSRFEGFPNALCEAMSIGLPSISFDCPSGPAEIIRNEENGILVPPENIEELVKAMQRLIGDSSLRRTLGENAKKITEELSIEKIAGLWEKVIQEVIGS